MIYAYLRVSTGMQTLENQKYGIKQYCKKHSMKIDFWFEEKVSGTKKASVRELGTVLRQLQKGDTLICAEFSRLGRSLPDVLETIQKINEKGAILLTLKENFILDDSLNAKILSSVLALIADISRELLSQRVKEGLAARKARGIKLGRRKGSKNKHNSLEDRKEFIEIMLRGGATRYQIKKRLGCHSWTLNNFLHETGLDKKYGIELSDNFVSNKLRIPNKKLNNK